MSRVVVYGLVAGDGPEVRGMVALGLSAAQARLYGYLFAATARDGFQPTVREACDHFGWSSPNAVNGLVRGLRHKGWIGAGRGDTSHTGLSRAYQFKRLPDGSPFLGFTPIRGGGEDAGSGGI